MPKIPSLPPMDAPDGADQLPVEDTSTGSTKSLTLTVLLEWLKNMMASTADVKLTAKATAPTGWLICDGTAISRSTYASLFDAIGTAFGEGNGSTTFNLPDLRDKYAIGKSATRPLGWTGGAETINLQHSHTVNSHSHTLTSYNTAGGRSDAGATGFQSAGGPLSLVSGSGSQTWSLANSTTNTQSPGTNNALSTTQSILPPSQAMNYIIKT